MQLSLVLGTLLCLYFAQSYKVLVYCPRFSQSINNFLGNIADTLVDAGHNVTTLIPIVNPLLRDGTLKSRKIYVQPTEEVNEITEAMNFDNVDFFNVDDFSLIQGIGMGYALSTWGTAQCRRMLDGGGVMERMREEQYDVMIVENMDVCGAALSHIIQPKSLITTCGSVPIAFMNYEFGLDATLSYNPNAIMEHLDVHSFWSRITNVYAEFIFHMTWMRTRSQINSLFSERFESFPGVTEICSHAAFAFINSEPLIDYAVPTLNRVLYVGGIGAKTPKKLDENFDRLFTLRNKTVLISFGSIVVASTLPLKVKQSIVQVVSRFPEVTFLWKYERLDDDFTKSVLASTPNLHMLQWVPQNDILADERLTAFITHGGMASTQEIAVRGKPGLFIPFMGDQPRNSGMMAKIGFGRVFNKFGLFDAEKLYAAVKDLLENDSYRETAQRISVMLQKKPFSARETLVRTVEFAAEFGPSAAFRPQSFDMNWIEYYNADIAAVFVVILITLVAVLLKLLSILVRKIVYPKEKRD